MLAFRPVECLIENRGDILAALGRRVACRFEVVANLDIWRVGEWSAGDETSCGDARKVGVGIGKRLMEVIHARRETIADGRSDRPVMSGRKIVDVNWSNFEEIWVDIRGADRRRLVALSHERTRI